MKVLISVLAATTFGVAIGFFIGVSFGDINAETDFCYDNSHHRFITDKSAREASCLR